MLVENESAFGRLWARVSDKIQDQVWFQQIKSKWEELDGQSRYAIKVGSFVIVVVCATGGVISMAMSTVASHAELQEKRFLIQKIQTSQEELRKLKETTARAGMGDDGPWNSYIQAQAMASGLDPASVTVSEPKKVSPTNSKSPALIEEMEFETTVKKINVRHLVKFVYNVENAGRMAKVKKLEVLTQPDESGYLDVTFTTLGYTAAATK